MPFIMGKGLKNMSEIAEFKLQKVNYYEQVADILEQSILNDINALEKLPSENELAKKFSVSRTIIREALKLLKERGLVQMKTGNGSFVTRPQASQVSELLTRFIKLDKISDDDIFNIRSCLESMACRIAVERADDNVLDSIEEIINEMEIHKEELELRVQLDCDFHVAIARASGNALLGVFVESMNELLRKVISIGIQYPGGNDDGIMRHRKILDALRKRDADQAEAMMKDHLQVSWDHVIHPN
jgi:GntR family transcriptional repressor for pyruvate dehydrogenase complex